MLIQYKECTYLDLALLSLLLSRSIITVLVTLDQICIHNVSDPFDKRQSLINMLFVRLLLFTGMVLGQLSIVD